MLTISIKLIISLILAGLIGWDREQHGRPAGFRTHILVGIGSTVIMIVSIMVFEKFPDSDADPGRIAAQVISGIGFLGAGTILIQGSTVKGLTTAASLWTTAAIGLAVGGGFYYVAGMGTLIVFIALFFLSSIEFRKGRVLKEQLICKIDAENKELYKLISNKLSEKDYKIKTIKLENDNTNKEVILNFKLEIDNKQKVELNCWLLELDGVKELVWKER